MLTPAQTGILRAAILADGAMSQATSTGDTIAISAWFNTVGTFMVWKSQTDTKELLEAISWANMTPVDTPDATVLWANRASACQSKQLNLQMMLSMDSVATGKPNIRAGLQSALTGIPSGVAGANRSAGAAEVLAVVQRAATRAEQFLATGAGTAVNPGSLTFEGLVTVEDAASLR